MAKYLDSDISMRFGPGGVDGTKMPITRTLYVDGARSDDYTEDGTGWRPFKTVQAAVDYAEANLEPAYDNPVVIRISPNGSSHYPEDVVIKRDGIHLIGTGTGYAGDNAAIRRLIVTNATAASYAAFVAAGGLTAPATHYGLLVQDSYEPWGIYVRDLQIGYMDGSWTDYRLLLLGVGDGNDTLSYEFDVSNVQVHGKGYFRLVNYVWFYGSSWINGILEAYNCSGLWWAWAGVDGAIIDYDSGDDEPSDTANYGFQGKHASFGGPNPIVVNGEAKLVCYITHIANALDVNETAFASIRGGHINGGDITVDGDATLELHGVHVQGAMTLENAGGLAGCTMDGGSLMGALTDGGARLTRNVSTI